MASLSDKLDLPVAAAAVEIGRTKAGDVKYTQCDTGNGLVYITRSDGAIDRSSRGGTISHRIMPPKGTMYVMATGGAAYSYFLRADGMVDRTGGGGKIDSTISPGDKCKFTSISAGASMSFFVRDDGRVEYLRTRTNKSLLMEPASGGAKYVMASSGFHNAYLLRDDGSVDRVVCFKNSGKADSTLTPPAGCTYVGVSSQSMGNGTAGPRFNFLVRSDGKVDRTSSDDGTMKGTISPPEGVQYVAAAAGIAQSYLLRSDGSIDRIGHDRDGAEPTQTITPPEGLAYSAVTTAEHNTGSYFLRSDGRVDRTARAGKITQTMDASAVVVQDSCLVM